MTPEEAQHNHPAQLTQKLESVSSVSDLCKHWKTDYRGVLVSAQSLLQFFIPAAARVLGVIITLVDGLCPSPLLP